MIPEFTCEFVPTVRICANRIKKLQPVRRWVFLIVGVLFFGYMTSSAMRFQFRGVWSLFFLVGVLYLLWGIFMPEINGFFFARRFQKETSGIYKVSFVDAIEVTQGSIRVIWQYSEINEVRNIGHSYELMRDKRMSIMLDPNGFTKGTFSEFKQFLREKRPDLTIPE